MGSDIVWLVVGAIIFAIVIGIAASAAMQREVKRQPAAEITGVDAAS